MKKIISLLLCAVLMCSSLTVIAAAPTISSVTCTARADGLHDVSVKVKADALYSELTLVVLGSDNNEIGPQMTIDGKTGYAYYIAQANTGASTSYTFTFTMQIPASMKDAADSIYVLSGNTGAAVASREITCEVSLNVGTNGTVKVGGETASGSVRVVSGGTLDLEFVPAAGYRVASATCGEQELVIVNNKATTPAITAATTLTVTFEEVTPTVAAFAKVFATGKDKDSVTFGRYDNVDGWEVKEYGVVYSNSNSEPKINGANCQALAAKTANTAGQFGIYLTNTALMGDSYYTRPYIKAVKNGESTEQYFYGTVTAYPVAE